MDSFKLAAISDIHGNRWALEAVLEDLYRHNIVQVVNLGDTLYGPLDPAGTVKLLRNLAVLGIRGNQDRAILEPGPEAGRSPTLRYVLASLGPDDLAWLGEHRPGAEVGDGRVALCHGTPRQDDVYLTERVTGRGMGIVGFAELAAELGEIGAEAVLCGHSHLSRLLMLPDGRLVVNPGSVGLPAYADETPYPHAMETGSPHARYAILTPGRTGWLVEQIAVAYDWGAAAAAAEERGRLDWAAWLRTGRASVE